MSEREIEREKPILLKLEILDLDPRLLKAIQEGHNVSAYYDDLPLEELLVLDTMTGKYPGLRWVLRRQRNRYILTILRGHHLEKPQVKGEP